MGGTNGRRSAVAQALRLLCANGQTAPDRGGGGLPQTVDQEPVRCVRVGSAMVNTPQPQLVGCLSRGRLHE